MLLSKRTHFGAVAVAALLFALAAPAAEAAQTAVTGTARHLGADPPFPTIQVHVNAFVDAGGLDPRGNMSVDAEGFHSYTGDVMCLSVFGDLATVGIQITKSSDPALVGQGELWNVRDAGPGGTDGIAGFAITPTPPVVCPPLFFEVPVVSGNYVIHSG